jgi:WD40 repeat protein
MKDHPEPREEQLTSLLAACDEALAAGTSLASSADVPAEVQGRLERGVACMKLLRQMLPQQPTPLPPGTPTSTDAPTVDAAPLPSSLGRFQIRREVGHGVVQRVVFSPDGKTLAGNWGMAGAGAIRYAVKVWDATSGQETHHLEAHLPLGTSSWALAFSPTGRYLASAWVDHRVKVWDLTTGKEVHTLKGHFDRVVSLAWSPDGHRLVSGAEDSLVKVWDAASGEELLTLRQANWRAVISLVFSPDGQRLISADDSQVKVWSAPIDPQATVARPPP